MKIKNNVNTLRTISINEFLDLEFNNLKDDSRNVEKLKKSIIKNGFSFPVFIWKDHNYVIDGAGRKKAIISLIKDGYYFDEIPVVDIEAKSLKEAKQKTLEASSSYGDITKDSFKIFIEDIDVDFETFDIKGISKDLFIEPDQKDDEVPETPKEPRSKLGDLYELGKHRVICGDSTKTEVAMELCGDRKVDMYLTDPPTTFRTRVKLKTPLQLKTTQCWMLNSENF